MSQAGLNNTSQGPVPPSVPTVFQTDDGAQVVPLANKLIVAGGIGAATTGNVGTGTVTVTVTNEGFAWSEKNADFSIQVGNGYFCNAALTATLPFVPAPTIGNSCIIYVDTASPVVVLAPLGQFIQVSNQLSSSGGSATSTALGSILDLVFKPSDNTWHDLSGIGTWTIV